MLLLGCEGDETTSAVDLVNLLDPCLLTVLSHLALAPSWHHCHFPLGLLAISQLLNMPSCCLIAVCHGGVVQQLGTTRSSLLLLGSGLHGWEHGEVWSRWTDRRCWLFYYSSGNFIGCSRGRGGQVCLGVSGWCESPSSGGFSPSHARQTLGSGASMQLGGGQVCLFAGAKRLREAAATSQISVFG